MDSARPPARGRQTSGFAVCPRLSQGVFLFLCCQQRRRWDRFQSHRSLRGVKGTVEVEVFNGGDEGTALPRNVARRDGFAKFHVVDDVSSARGETREEVALDDIEVVHLVEPLV